MGYPDHVKHGKTVTKNSIKNITNIVL